MASCSGKGRDQESRSDKPSWGHQSSPRHFVTARRSLRGSGEGPGQTGSARCPAAATFPGMHFLHPKKQGCVQKASVNGLPVEATRFLVSLGYKSPDGDMPVASILQELLWFGSRKLDRKLSRAESERWGCCLYFPPVTIPSRGKARSPAPGSRSSPLQEEEHRGDAQRAQCLQKAAAATTGGAKSTEGGRAAGKPTVLKTTPARLHAFRSSFFFQVCSRRAAEFSCLLFLSLSRPQDSLEASPV